ALRLADRVLRPGRRAPAPPAAGPDAPLHPADALAGGTDAGVAAEVAVRGFRRGPGPLAGLARGRRAAAARLPGGVRAALLSRLGSGAKRRGAAGHAADGDAAVVAGAVEAGRAGGRRTGVTSEKARRASEGFGPSLARRASIRPLAGASGFPGHARQ